MLWLAKQLDVPLDMPAAHPFNPIVLLRMALAAASNKRQIAATMAIAMTSTLIATRFRLQEV